jgi:hypothetical protein
MSRFRRKWILIGAISIILISGIAFLFFTPMGIGVQLAYVEKYECRNTPYLRFLADRATGLQKHDSQWNRRIASIYSQLATEDLRTALRVLDQAVEMDMSGVTMYAERGVVNMRLGQYREAQSDFMNAVRNWRGQGLGTSSVRPHQVYSNCLIEATLCLEAHEGAWGKTNR